MKELGQFFRKNRLALTEDFVKELIREVPRGKMGEFVRHLEIVQVHGEASISSGLRAEEPTLTKTTTVHLGLPPKLSEIVETPGSKILGANLIKRYGEQPPQGYAAHHIIPERQFGEGLDWMRRRFGKDINDADNGVFLAAVGSAAPKKAPTLNPDLTVLHQSYIHAGPSRDYAYTLTRRLSGLHGNEFIAELRRIANEMSNGTFKIDEIPYGWKEKWQSGMTAPIEPGFEPGWIEE